MPRAPATARGYTSSRPGSSSTLDPIGGSSAWCSISHYLPERLTLPNHDPHVLIGSTGCRQGKHGHTKPPAASYEESTRTDEEDIRVSGICLPEALSDAESELRESH